MFIFQHHNNRLTGENSLLVSSVHLGKAIGRRGFLTAASVAWNRLLLKVRSSQGGHGKAVVTSVE